MTEEMKYCYKYPHPAVTTDCVVFGFDGSGLSILLIQRGIEPFKGKWALPGGFIHMDETAEEGARRELEEETGVKDIFIEQLQAFSGVDRDPRERVITIAFCALVRQKDYNVIGGDDAAEARWFPLDDVPELAFDHETILKYAQEHLRQRIHFEPIGFQLLDKQFTMPQLQAIYEAVMNTKFDRRNFSKKMLAEGYIEPTGKMAKLEEGEAHRAPKLFKFIEEKYNQAKGITTKQTTMEIPQNRITPEFVTELKENEIFVFGSNLAGMHGGGAALIAARKFGAQMGVGVGRTGKSYAIPTMHGGIDAIKPYVDDFICYAKATPKLHFLVTRIGCGIAGFRDEEMAPLFKECMALENVSLPESFWKVMTK